MKAPNALRVDVSHLVDLPYQLGGANPREGGVDCLWTARQVLALIFNDLESSEFPVSSDEEEMMLTRVRAGETRWIKVGASAASARKLGDVIHGQDEDGLPYVAVLFDQVTPLALTANRKRGVHRRPLRSLAGIQAVFRRASYS